MMKINGMPAPSLARWLVEHHRLNEKSYPRLCRVVDHVGLSRSRSTVRWSAAQFAVRIHIHFQPCVQ